MYAVYEDYVHDNDVKILLNCKIRILVSHLHIISSAFYASWYENISWFYLNFQKEGQSAYTELGNTVPKTHFFGLENKGQFIPRVGLYTGIYDKKTKSQTKKNLVI